MTPSQFRHLHHTPPPWPRRWLWQAPLYAVVAAGIAAGVYAAWFM